MNEVIEKCDKVINKIIQVQKTIKELRQELEGDKQHDKVRRVNKASKRMVQEVKG